MDWQDKTRVKKGNIGEALVKDFLESKDLMVYGMMTPGAHLVDYIVTTKDKKEMFIAEVKTKPGRKYVADTGFDTRHLNEYKNTVLPVHMFFVDEDSKTIYSGNLNTMLISRVVGHRTYPMEGTGEWDSHITYFPREIMGYCCDISEENINKLKQFNNSSYR